jgi:hypothetical protein
MLNTNNKLLYIVKIIVFIYLYLNSLTIYIKIFSTDKNLNNKNLDVSDIFKDTTHYYKKSKNFLKIEGYNCHENYECNEGHNCNSFGYCNN